MHARERRYKDLMEPSRIEPSISFEWAIMISSKDIHDEGDMIRRRVNYWFPVEDRDELVYLAGLV